MPITTSKFLRIIAMAMVLGASIALAWTCLVVISRPAAPFSASAHSFVGNDFVAFYAGAVLASRGRPEDVYDLEALHSVEARVAKSQEFPLLPMAYPPFFQLLLMPLSHLDYLTAYRVWVALTLTLLMVVVWRISPHWRTLALVPIFPAVAFCGAAGQNGNLSAAILGSGLLLLPRSQIAAGIAFGLMAYKPQLALAVPLCLIAGGHYRALVATAATATATVLASILAFGFAPILAFVPNLHGQFELFFGTQQFSVWQRMPTVLVTMLQVTGSQPLAWATHGLTAGLASAALVWVWRRSVDQGVRSWALAATIPLLTPYFIDYDLALFVIPFAFLSREIQLAGFTGARALAVSALWLAQPIVFLLPALLPLGAPNTAQWSPCLWALLLVGAVWRVRQDRAAVVVSSVANSVC